MRIPIKKDTIIFILFACTLLWLIFSTSTFYGKSNFQPINIYYLYEDGYKKYPQASKINSFTFNIYEPFNRGYSEVDIDFVNLEKKIDFWGKTDTDLETFNSEKAAKYMQDNLPDYLLLAPFLENGKLGMWSQYFLNQPLAGGYTEPIFKETSFGVWESKLYFDSRHSKASGRGWAVNFEGGTYLGAEVNKIVFNITIPDSFEIRDIGSMPMKALPGKYELSKELVRGDKFHIVIKRYQTVKKIVSSLSLAISITLLGLLLAPFFGEIMRK
ncbi:MAG: hypothetical protein JW743_08705 [Deltaproteobacteria bacterium]|nr:hypothetical protein [Deltaproteobacteria bacterium]MBN2844571.1 hypothetical protein [Deltaproteobacteria bacterium]